MKKTVCKTSRLCRELFPKSELVQTYTLQKGLYITMKILIATNNKGKLMEFNKILSELSIECVSLSDMKINANVPETEDTFLGNARLKAKEIYKIAKMPVISDDSGLLTDALDGRPGVLSARFSGENSDDNKNIEKLLFELRDVPDDKRTARFKSVVYFVYDDNTEIYAEGSCEGVILHEKRGNNGFGYDPVFYVKEFEKTFAELTNEEKNSISHRGRAIMALKSRLNEVR